MLFSLALILLVGLSAAAIFQFLRLPRIIGMLFTGIVTGPFVLDLLDPSILGISSELRQIALIIILFVLVGAAVDIRYTLDAGLAAVGMIFLAVRSLGVLICLVGTKLSAREKAFCVISYLPKATVQAAIGSVPMSLGLGCGKIVLSVAVLAILITAPLGAIGIDATAKRFLSDDR